MIGPLRFGSVLAIMVLATAVTGVTASIVVPASQAGTMLTPVTPADLAPPACSSFPPSFVVSGAGTVSGGTGDDLVLGSGGPDELRGGRGNDCVLGGGGDDALRGDQGTDVCIGGPGVDTFHPTCETQIQ